jgi:hypothetical protein
VCSHTLTTQSIILVLPILADTSTAIVGLDDGSTVIGSDISEDGEHHSNFNLLIVIINIILNSYCKNVSNRCLRLC